MTEIFNDVNDRFARIDSLNQRLLALEQREDSIANAARVADSLKKAEEQQRGLLPGGKKPWTLYGGMSFDEWQTVIGGRLDFGPVNPNWRSVHFEPEVALGFFSSATTVMGAANLQYRFPGTLGSDRFRLFVEGGAGVMYFSEELGRYDNGFEAVLNFGVGSTINLNKSEGVRPQLFVEYQGVDLFKLNRLLVGLRTGF